MQFFLAWKQIESTLSRAEIRWYEDAMRSVVFVTPSRFSDESEEVVFHGGRYFPGDFEDIAQHIPKKAKIWLFVASGPWSAGGTVLFKSEADYLAHELELRGISRDRITCMASAKNTPQEVEEALLRISGRKMGIITHRLHAQRVIQTYRARGITPEACFSPRQDSPLTLQDMARALMEMRRLQVYAQCGDIAPIPFEQQRKLESIFLNLEQRGSGILEALHRECPDKN